MPFDCAADLVNIQAHLTPHRLEKYLKLCGDDLVAAVRLYVWNSAISSAFNFPLQAAEVALRNALDRELSTTYCASWYDDVAFLDLDATSKEPRLRRLVEDAKTKLRNRKKPIDPPHMVAALDFGFWTNLVGRHTEPALWAPALHRAFPHYVSITGSRLKRNPIAAKIDGLRAFRNRIAHHEPILHRDLSADFDSILSVCSWMFCDLREWVEYHSSVPMVLAARP